MGGSGDWSDYYDAAGDTPRETLLFALERFEREEPRERFAVDLGCGTGRDAIELLRRGWRVLAIDGQAEAIERLSGRAELPAPDRLQARVARFEDAEWPEAELVNSSYALPFCPPDAFPGVWRRIVSSLRPGGRFSGQLFGDRDGWSGDAGMTFLAREELEALLSGLAVERMREVEEDGMTAVGTPKHWHFYDLVVREAGA